MPKDELLPGVTTVASPPVAVCASGPVVRGARRRAALRDALQLVLLLAVDVLFLDWPEAQLPLLGRDDSVVILAAVNAIVVTSVVVGRLFPRWSARRIATTWCPEERRHLEAAMRRR
ncbi:MAG TPA: hypothetical protein VNL91_08160 [Thermoanaerobaculia bacterium]|nr:hypothetical protein [Thermoanaerobaculia bacterium]